MAFCNQCGAQLQDGATFCTACGAQQNAAPQAQQPQQPQYQQPQQQPQQPQQNSGFDVNAMLFNTPDFTSQMDPADIQANQGISYLSYLWLLFLVPLFAAKESKFARFHANQGLLLCICGTVIGILSAVFPWWLGWIFWLADLCVFVLFVVGIINVNKGQAKELPFIGKIRIIK